MVGELFATVGDFLLLFYNSVLCIVLRHNAMIHIIKTINSLGLHTFRLLKIALLVSSCWLTANGMNETFDIPVSSLHKKATPTFLKGLPNPIITTRDTTICNGEIIDVSVLASTTSGTLTFHNATPPNGGNMLASTTITPTTNSVIYVLATDGPDTDTAEIRITHSIPDSVLLCSSGANSATFSAESGLTGVEWFNSAGTSVGTGDDVTIDANTAGLEDGNDQFYYTAQDGNGCTIGICCPIVVQTEVCCSTTLTANLNPTVACIGSIDTIDANPSGGSGNYTAHTWTTLGTGSATGFTLNNTANQKLAIDGTNAITGTIDLQYTVTDDAGCSSTINHTVTLTQSSMATICADTTNYATLHADTGLTSIIWYNANDVQVGIGDSLTVNAGTAGLEDGMETYYYTANNISGCQVGLCCPVLVTLEDCGTYDWGDLPDTDPTTSTNNYQTNAANNGPSHRIIDGLRLGTLIDAETDGQSSSDAFGDAGDEDGLLLFSSLDLFPGQTIRLPFSYTNTTGNTAYVTAWIDWNGDGDFEDVDEMVADWNDETTMFSDRMEVTIPSIVKLDTALGWRIRISHQDNMTPYGPQPNGEVEDYLVTVACSEICIPIKATVLKK